MRALRLTIVATLWPLRASSHAVELTGVSPSGEWLLTSLLLLAGGWYFVGFLRVYRSAAAGRSRLGMQASMFGTGWAVIAVSLLSPLHGLGGRSFTAHMIEHELLMLVAAPLMSWSQPLGIFLWALPGRMRRSLGEVSHRPSYEATWKAMSSATGASLIQALMLWLWHAPALFNAALLSETWHTLQHLCLFGSALLFWWSMHRVSSRERRHGVAAFWLFFTSLHSGLLGALMAFSVSPWYARYVSLALQGMPGLSPMEDQQLAGLIMWIPGGAIHAIVALVYLNRWFQVPWRGAPLHQVPR